MKFIATSTVEFKSTPFPKAQQECLPSFGDIIMRKIALLVIFSYTCMLLKPAAPVFMDVMAHTFWQSQHMLVVHEVHGKFHVHNEVVSASGKHSKEKAGCVKVETEYHCCPVPIKVTHPFFSAWEVKIYPAYICGHKMSCIDMNYPPPRA